MTRARRVLLGVGVAALAAGPLAGPAAPASATTYRYWSYWHGSSGAWSYSQLGPDSYHVRDRAVEGWRFGRGGASSSTTVPRTPADYDALCPQQPTPPAGQQRVALVVDFGTESDSPGGYGKRCLTVPSDADSGTQVLRAAGRTLRFGSSGLLCAIDGYPKPPECGEVVADASPAPSPTASRIASARPARARPAAARPTPSPAAASSALPQVLPARRLRLGRPRPSASPSGTPTPAPPAAAPVATPATVTPEPTVSDLAAPPPRRSTGVPWGLLAGAAAVVAVGGAGVARARRR